MKTTDFQQRIIQYLKIHDWTEGSSDSYVGIVYPTMTDPSGCRFMVWVGPDWWWMERFTESGVEGVAGRWIQVEEGVTLEALIAELAARELVIAAGFLDEEHLANERDRR